MSEPHSNLMGKELLLPRWCSPRRKIIPRGRRRRRKELAVTLMWCHKGGPALGSQLHHPWIGDGPSPRCYFQASVSQSLCGKREKKKQKKPSGEHWSAPKHSDHGKAFSTDMVSNAHPHDFYLCEEDGLWVPRHCSSLQLWKGKKFMALALQGQVPVAQGLGKLQPVWGTQPRQSFAATWFSWFSIPAVNNWY